MNSGSEVLSSNNPLQISLSSTIPFRSEDLDTPTRIVSKPSNPKQKEMPPTFLQLEDPVFREFILSTRTLFKEDAIIFEQYSIINDLEDINPYANLPYYIQLCATRYSQALSQLLDSLVENQTDSTNSYEDQLMIIKSMYIIWSFLEFNNSNDFLKPGTISTQLEYAVKFSAWYRSNFSELNSNLDLDALENHLLTGNLEQAVHILNSLDATHDHVIKNILDGLVFMLTHHPIYDPYNVDIISRYRENANVFISNMPPLSEQYQWLYDIARIICGDEHFIASKY
ncbi:hypothetical protein BB560_002278 [Smittium megazygosporum]|uniref:Nuclear pore complex protein Nup85 n=1 Tax=Smittium megazygosporum TaxID=133381 RepID=A0A2T9ZF85_9FUNG|nr:hypothetical protein BB560_002278 [Smittium megazygosporum]